VFGKNNHGAEIPGRILPVTSRYFDIYDSGKLILIILDECAKRDRLVNATSQAFDAILGVLWALVSRCRWKYC